MLRQSGILSGALVLIVASCALVAPAQTASPSESKRWDSAGFIVESPKATADEARNGAQKRSFYGTEILAADLAAFSLLGVGFASENVEIAGVGAVSYLGASIGSGMGKTKCASNEWCMVPNAKYIADGLVTGAVIASVLDVSLLGWRSEEPTRTTSVPVRPFVSPSRDRLSFGVTGRF